MSSQEGGREADGQKPVVLARLATVPNSPTPAQAECAGGGFEFQEAPGAVHRAMASQVEAELKDVCLDQELATGVAGLLLVPIDRQLGTAGLLPDQSSSGGDRVATLELAMGDRARDDAGSWSGGTEYGRGRNGVFVESVHTQPPLNRGFCRDSTIFGNIVPDLGRRRSATSEAEERVVAGGGSVPLVTTIREAGHSGDIRPVRGRQVEILLRCIGPGGGKPDERELVLQGRTKK